MKSRIEKLLRLAKNQPHTPEGKNALAHAKRLMAKHGFTEADFRKPPTPPPEPERVWIADISSVLLGGLNRKPRSFDEELTDAANRLRDLFR